MPELDESLRILPLLSKDLPQSGFDRIIHVTHQLPFEISRTDNDDNHQWSFAPRRGHGAMYAGIESLKNEWKSIHIGWTGEIHGQPDAETNNKTTLELAHDDKERLAKDLEEAHGCIPLYLDSESVAGHYDGYCKTSMFLVTSMRDQIMID